MLMSPSPATKSWEAYKAHTAINTSTEDRFHLVICAVDDEHLYENVPIGRVTVASAPTV
jgi:hypothetical protein